MGQGRLVEEDMKANISGRKMKVNPWCEWALCIVQWMIRYPSVNDDPDKNYGWHHGLLTFPSRAPHPVLSPDYGNFVPTSAPYCDATSPMAISQLSLIQFWSAVGQPTARPKKIASEEPGGSSAFVASCIVTIPANDPVKPFAVREYEHCTRYRRPRCKVSKQKSDRTNYLLFIWLTK